MQRIAVPMIGGMISSTLLTLIVIPAIFGLVKGWCLSRTTAAIVPTNDLGPTKTIQPVGQISDA